MPSASAGNDLMSDLFTKLNQRRKGISGSHQQGSSTLDKMSSLIPAPPDSDRDSPTDSDHWDD